LLSVRRCSDYKEFNILAKGLNSFENEDEGSLAAMFWQAISLKWSFVDIF
jgi:hypothetical protein